MLRLVQVRAWGAWNEKVSAGFSFGSVFAGLRAGKGSRYRTSGVAGGFGAEWQD